MADDSVVAAASASEHAPSRRPQNKKIEGKGSCRGKRTRSESNLGLKPTNKRKKGVGSTDVAEVDIDNTGAGVDNDEVEALQQEKQRLLAELRRYTVLGDASADTPPPPHTSLSRRNSQTSLVGAPPSSSPAALPSSSTDPMNPTSSFRHWDFLLQEMQWMSTDFAQERKWRIRKAKTLSLSVTSYHGKKSTAAMRTLQHEEQARKRFAAKMGRDVKKFWLKVDKLVAHQVKAAEDSRRKASMETQLQFLLQQTEKYASALATTFAMADAMMHDANNQISYDEEGSDFSEVEEPADDESTIEAEEQLQSKADVAMEVALLQEESTMSIQALHAKYAAIMEEGEEEEEGEDGDDLAWNKDVTPAINLDEKTRIQTRGQAEGTESDGDFEMDDIEEAADDESTIEAEEQFQSKADVDMEVQLLQEESTLSIEALRAKYAAIMDEEEEEDMHGTTTLAQTAPVETSRTKRATSKRMSDMVPLTDDANDVWTQVGLERPFLLHHTLHLRAYQATGVAWLLSLAHNRMNGILADEMGLGKTIQTISLLAALATEGLWGPHLVIVPTSCILNWEMEFKRWCPGFKVMTYYGSAKRRKELRLGWSKVNAFQVCITSYQLVVADAPCFKRKKWYYLILDEAHNIKNWKSQRWQTLLTFNTQRRLLLTGTPLQNNLMELWALMHFLMPHLFRSRAQFSHWFSTPMNAMVEGEAAVNDQLVSRLHNIIRPFVLRRLKKDVAKQMPGKFEHVVVCSLSKRQRFLYEDFMARSSTRKALSGGNFMGMMNVLMQLRKVCNHPDLFEARPVLCPFDMAPLTVSYPFANLAVVGRHRRTLGCFYPDNGLVTSEVAWQARRTLAPSVQVFIDDVSMAPLEKEEQEEWLQQYATLWNFATQQKTLRQAATRAKATANAWINHWRCMETTPFISHELLRIATMPVFISPAMDVHNKVGKATSTALAAMVQSPTSRLNDWLEIMLKVLCFVHKARTTAPTLVVGSTLSAGRVQDALHSKETNDQLHAALDPAWTMLHPITQRQHLYFPDKRLIQFDCGKLQQLDRLLRELKRGSHRCLIFSQMSSMLNILEIFLNVHGHTYFRLDGSTPVEQRQRLMDKFNTDPKVFCFILSTRSGGLGINLTGADTVIFYDSDWNPAMDAQAQDRAHRIGQTRDVHIYRLVSAHTVEQNILKKARQKKHLDFLVLSEGQFTTEYFSKSNLRALIGPATAQDHDGDDVASISSNENTAADMRTIQDAMAQCEDEADVAAMKGVELEQEAAKAQDETFDDEENAAVDTVSATASGEAVEASASLRPIDQYAITYRCTTDPLFDGSVVDVLPVDYAEEEVELERIEAMKVVDEEMAIQDGDLIVAAEPVDVKTQKRLYVRERSHVKSEKRRRALTGAAWMPKTCSRSNLPFYYNTDTHEAIWDRPLVWVTNDEHAHAVTVGYGGLSIPTLLHLLGFATAKDRMASCVNKQWTVAARHPSFHKRVHSTDSVAAVQSLLSALEACDTVAFGSGVHSMPTAVHIRCPVRFTGPPLTRGSTCTLEFSPVNEMSGLVWHAKAGEISNLTVQIPTSSSSPNMSTKSRRNVVLTVASDSNLTVLDSRILGGDVAVAVQGGTATLVDVDIADAVGSGVVVQGGFVAIVACRVSGHGRCGLAMVHGAGIVRRSWFALNGRYGVRLLGGVQMAMLDTNSFENNRCGALDIEHSHRRIYIRNCTISQHVDVPRPHSHERLKFKGWQYECVDTCAAPKPKPDKKDKKLQLKDKVVSGLPMTNDVLVPAASIGVAPYLTAAPPAFTLATSSCTKLQNDEPEIL